MHKQFIDDIEFTFSQAAFDTEIMREIYGLRYQVYCHECHFIREEDYPESIEKDVYDPHSVHFFTRTDHGIIGTARLILDNPHGFPFEALCGDSLCKERLSGISRAALAEISRLVISKKLKKKNYAAHQITPEDIVGKQVRDKEEMNRIKHLAMGFYREIYQESKRRGITHLFAWMEKTLWLLLKRNYFKFDQIGETIHFFGPVSPYLCDIAAAEEHLRRKAPETLKYLMEGL